MVFGFPFEEFVVTNYYIPWMPVGDIGESVRIRGNGDKIDKVKLTKVVNYCAIIVLA